MNRNDFYHSEISRILGEGPGSAEGQAEESPISIYDDVPGAFDCFGPDGTGQDSLDYADEARFHGEGA